MESAMGSQFHVLEKKLEEKRWQRECLRIETLTRLKEALQKSPIPFDAAYIFGSVTKPGKFYEASDIDIGFLGLKDEDFFAMVSYLTLELERDVDVVQLENHRLREKIQMEGIRWTREDLPSSRQS